MTRLDAQLASARELRSVESRDHRPSPEAVQNWRRNLARIYAIARGLCLDCEHPVELCDCGPEMTSKWCACGHQHQHHRPTTAKCRIAGCGCDEYSHEETPATRADRGCPECHGAGEVTWNPSWRGDPQYERSGRCATCDGAGMVTRREAREARRRQLEVHGLDSPSEWDTGREDREI